MDKLVKTARNALCLSQRDLAEVWGMGHGAERRTHHPPLGTRRRAGEPNCRLLHPAHG